MSEIKGTTWDFRGNQIGPKSALALCYVSGWRGKDRLITAASVMTAESQRYVRAWHLNHEHDLEGNNVYRNDTGEPIFFSADHGLFQINRPELEPFDDELFNPKTNAKLAFALFEQRHFQPWAAYNSGAYLKFVPEFEKKYSIERGNFVGTWRLLIPKWEAYAG